MLETSDNLQATLSSTTYTKYQIKADRMSQDKVQALAYFRAARDAIKKVEDLERIMALMQR